MDLFYGVFLGNFLIEITYNLQSQKDHQPYIIKSHISGDLCNKKNILPKIWFFFGWNSKLMFWRAPLSIIFFGSPINLNRNGYFSFCSKKPCNIFCPSHLTAEIQNLRCVVATTTQYHSNRNEWIIFGYDMYTKGEISIACRQRLCSTFRVVNGWSHVTCLSNFLCTIARKLKKRLIHATAKKAKKINFIHGSHYFVIGYSRTFLTLDAHYFIRFVCIPNLIFFIM